MFIRPHRREAVNNVGLESTPGTAASTTFSFDYEGEGLSPNVQNEHAEINAASTHPETTEHVPVGRTVETSLAPLVNAATIRDLLLMTFPQGGGEFPTFTMDTDNSAIEDERLVGAVVTQQEWIFQRQAGGGDGMVLRCNMQIQAAKYPAGVTVSETAYPAGNLFLMNKMAATVNSVAALDILDWTWRRTVAWAVGPPDANLDALYLTRGLVKNEFTLRASYDAAAWLALVAGQTKFACQFVLDTGATNETVTIDAGACKGRSHSVSGEEEVTETLELVTQHTGSAESVPEPTFGIAIAASRLGL